MLRINTEYCRIWLNIYPLVAERDWIMRKGPDTKMPIYIYAPFLHPWSIITKYIIWGYISKGDGLWLIQTYITQLCMVYYTYIKCTLDNGARRCLMLSKYILYGNIFICAWFHTIYSHSQIEYVIQRHKECFICVAFAKWYSKACLFFSFLNMVIF